MGRARERREAAGSARAEGPLGAREAERGLLGGGEAAEVHEPVHGTMGRHMGGWEWVHAMPRQHGAMEPEPLARGSSEAWSVA